MSVRPADDQTGEETSASTRRPALPRMIAGAPWVVFLVGVAVLAVLLVVAALSFRGPEEQAARAPEPPVVLPVPPESTKPAGSTDEAAPPDPAAPTGSPSATPTVATTSGVPSPSAGAGSPTAAVSRAPAASPPAPTPSASSPGVLLASYRLQSVDGDSFRAELVVRNGTGHPVDWQVDLAFTPEVVGIRASSGPGVSVSIKGGGRYLLSGSRSLAAGAQQTVQLRVSRTGGGEQPTRCTINGAACAAG
ncbi:hypothetical protein GCM10011608_49570 [Micromonospora sonchi]|uniref:CBM2 domain-containing protein n=1 Tax=Micromonospora sonchi TaxID=1763543 RepID=A0A917U6K1_9ACTN|nr:hypothetical protein [Micromonospora sonchi]GGM58655.1 hypothetical protein GCM10011608_49570 [Micromonospora sonchi]